MKITGKACGGPLGLEIAGFRCVFKSDFHGIISVMGRRYGRFRTNKSAEHVFEAVPAAGRQNPFKPAVELRGSRLTLERGDFRADLDLKTGLGGLRAAPNEQCLDAFLRSLISSLLLRSGGFMLHSAGIVKGGKAYIFLGKSGAGKSTLSKLAAAAGAGVVSDEINLLRHESGKFRVYGSPFWGEMRSDGRPGAWPLGGIFLLKKAKKNRLAPCSKPEALKLLLRCLVNFDPSPAAAEKVIGNSARLLSKAAFSRLEFSKENAGFLELIR